MTIRTVVGRSLGRRLSTSTEAALQRFPGAKLFIDNEFVDAEGGARLAVHTPRDGTIFAEIANASNADVDR